MDMTTDIFYLKPVSADYCCILVPSVLMHFEFDAAYFGGKINGKRASVVLWETK